MKKSLTVFLLLLNFSIFSQTNLSGIINSYTSVTAIDTCTGTISVDTTFGFLPNEKFLIIQIQGAKITESNSASFGNITDLGSAGLFEIGTIKSLSGKEIIIENSLLNQYDPNGSVQIVSFPEFENARIVDTVRALPWDGEKGGIVAFQVTNELLFEAPIDVSGLGFRGGEIQTIANPCTGGLNRATAYFYDETNWRGAKKGEGVAKYISGKDFGRGAQANGGGGGNDHNSGGGGGANYTEGGIGGIRETDFFTGACKGDNPGEAGKAISVTDNRVFFGGGGGAGHDNNMVATSGGNGGGMVFLLAENVEVISDGTIAANGISILQTANGDGAGGGGAGGSVVLKIENLKTDLDIEAIGGTGGTVNNGNTDRSFGPGGGGSGGVIKEEVTNRLNGSQTLNFLDGGQPGLTTNTIRSSNNTTNEAEAGTSGRKSTFLGISEGNMPVGTPIFDPEPRQTNIACAGTDAQISGLAIGSGITYQWQVFDGSDFVDLQDGANFSGAMTGTLTIINPEISQNGSQFQLVATNQCGISATARISTLTVQPPAIANFNFVISGTDVQFLDSSIGASNLLWNFGNNNTSTDPNPTFDFGMPGSYTVTLTATGSAPCGIDQFTQTIVIGDNAPPIADFSVDSMSGCVPATFQLTNLSSSNTDNIMWIFPGGNPSNSFDENPTVTYNLPGNYDVILVATNLNGNDTLVRSGIFTVRTTPTADFDFTVNGKTVTFNDLSIGADSYAWDFGDNQMGLSENPQHIYLTDGTYTVELVVTNPCGTDRITREITLGSVPTAAFDSDKTGGCAPMSVTYTDNSTGSSLTRKWLFPGGDPATSTDDQVRVIYNTPGLFDVFLIVENSVATDTLKRINFIEALPRPFAGFDYTTSGSTATFNNTSSNANDFMWDFGDGSSSTESNPVHTFPSNGSYFVTLNALNPFCSGSITISVDITSTGTENVFETGAVQIFPNPASDFLKIDFAPDFFNQSIRIEIADLAGRTVFSKSNIRQSPTIEVASLTGGIYFVRLISERGEFVTKFVKAER